MGIYRHLKRLRLSLSHCRSHPSERKPYKSQRAAYNRFVRAHHIRLAPYRIIDRDACFALFHRCVYQKEDIPLSRSGPNQDVARLMLRDAASAHRVALQEYRELGLTRRIVWVDGSVKAYTFGYPPLSGGILCAAGGSRSISLRVSPVSFPRILSRVSVVSIDEYDG